MPTQTQRNAFFSGAADSHTNIPLAFSAGWFLEELEFRVSFCTDNFDNATFRNWKSARVGWGVWFGPSSAPAASWSTDRTDSEWVWWQASPWIPDYETVVTAGVATPANSYRAGMQDLMLVIPVYREANGVEYQLRVYDVDSELASFPAYTTQGEVAAHVAFP